MRAIAIDRFGGPEVLVPHDLPVPKISPQEVLIKIDTAGVGIWDAHAREGAWGEAEFPLILGIDGSGTITEVGSSVRRFAIGDRVYAYSHQNPKGGFYAEYVAVAASKVARVPDGLGLREAGAIGTIGLTALQGVDDALAIEDGETLLIHGASGNVGMLALQFAKYRGARVLATASGRKGEKFVRKLGADASVDGKDGDIKAAAREFAPEPRKRRGIKFTSYDGTPGVREFDRLNRAIEKSRLQVPIAASFALKKADRAHRRLGEHQVLGKIVLYN